MFRFIPILLCLSSTLFAQKEDYIWHLGKDQQPQEGIQAMQVDFNKDSFHVDVRDFPVGFHHNNQAICDENGDLLFYTNGCAIVNRNHEIMPNGHRMNWDSLFTAVIGWNEDCRLGYPGTQNLLILDDPGYEHGYYLFHKPGVLENIRENFFLEFRMSYVDMQLDNGLGDVVFVDSLLLEEEIPMGAYLSAIKHQNGKDWWILQPLLHTNTISIFLLDHNGIHRVPDQEVSIYFSEIKSEARGTARFSPDGSQYAFFNRQDNLHLYDFD